MDGSFLGAQLPIMGEYYLGDIDDKCFYFGGGFNAAFMASGDGGGPILGPVFGLGGQFEVKKRLIGLRANYTLGINSPKEPGIEYEKNSRGAFTLSTYITF